MMLCCSSSNVEIGGIGGAWGKTSLLFVREKEVKEGKGGWVKGRRMSGKIVLD